MKVIAAIGTAAALLRETTDLALEAETSRIPDDWKMSNAELDMMIEKKPEPAKPKSVSELSFSEMLGASNNQKKLESITALQMEAEIGKMPKGVELSEEELNETLPSEYHKHNSNSLNQMSFSEMINASNNQEKLYEITNIGLESDISRIPDSWQLSDDEYNKINARIERGPAHQFPKDVDTMSFSEELTAEAEMYGENQDKLYEAMKQDEFVQTSFVSQDNMLSVQEDNDIIKPVVFGQRHGPKKIEDYSFSEAVEATNPVENVQIGWMDNKNELTEKETNSIVGQYLPREVRKNANNLKKEIHSTIDMDDASFSESVEALSAMNAAE